MNKERAIEFARKTFEKHEATFTQLNDYTQEIVFKKPGTGIYGMRFVLSGNCVFVCGDCGEGVYCLAEQARIDRIAGNYDLGYFTGKLRCNDGGEYVFDSDTAIEGINEDMSEWEKDELTAERKEAYGELIEIARCCSSIEEWSIELARNEDMLNDQFGEWWEWLPSVGNELRTSVVMYWVALKMAGQQLGYEDKYFK